MDFRRGALMAGAFALVLVLSASRAVAEETKAVTMTVTAVAKKEVVVPAVTKDDVQFYLNKERRQVADWRRGEKLFLAVLIDDSLDSSVAGQWDDLRAFFAAQLNTTYISVF